MGWSAAIPFRFASEVDAMLFMRALQSGEKTRLDLVVPPFVTREGKAIVNPNWRNAPFELTAVPVKATV